MNLFFAAVNQCPGNSNALINASSLPHTCANPTTLHALSTIAYVVIASIAVMILVIAGLRYIFSEGNPNMVAESKRMIIYTAVGLVIAVLAVTIVNAVVGQL